jgi:hypothetical protein
MDYRFCGQHRKRLWLLLGCMIFALALLTSCGGSSGSGGSSSGLSYSGSTAPAEISEQNAAQLSADVMTVGSNSSALNTIGTMENRSGENGSEPFILPAMTTALKDAVNQMDLSLPASQDLSAAVQTRSDTFYGDCSAGDNGSATYSIQVNNQTRAFSGTLKFSDFCVDRTVIDGTTTFSGTVDAQSEGLQSFTLAFDNLTVSSGDFAFTFNGTFEMNLASSEAGATMNLLVKNNQTGDIYQVKDYSMSVTDYGSYKSIEISGTFYDPDNGYVTVETTDADPLLYKDSATYPYAGQIVLTGSGGSTAQLTAIDDNTCQLKVDADGDGNYEFDSGEISWDELRLVGVTSE